LGVPILRDRGLGRVCGSSGQHNGVFAEYGESSGPNARAEAAARELQGYENESLAFPHLGGSVVYLLSGTPYGGVVRRGWYPAAATQVDATSRSRVRPADGTFPPCFGLGDQQGHVANRAP
jgi:hypothetical protein